MNERELGLINDLCMAIEQLTDEVRVLRITVDELQDEIQWTHRNLPHEAASVMQPFRVTSMALDPCDRDWGKKLNQVWVEELAELQEEASSRKQAELW